VNVDSAPGEADLEAKALICAVTESMATVATAYASQVPLPALAKTSGMIRAGVAEGAMFAIDCDTTSQKESASFFSRV